ncbi:MotA/TolQ/ExbB proton channel family protein [Methylobacterium variabile]|jgi:MotA/TolQ/ExbB proton channel family|uniref:MotA/TolQ/ExbB proton channel family protein n=1 Tax=Methylobacterium variabile TaxID=298794 RepID=UPI00069F852C|nr:MotA/TolQ/ExbB proton channel family protein [Methylobacterium variabile]
MSAETATRTPVAETASVPADAARSAPARRRPPLAENRATLAAVTGLVGVALCAVFGLTLPDHAAKLLIDRGGLLYPFSVQNFMWVAFCIAAGELAARMRAASRELRQLRLGYLPEDPRTVLQADDLGPIYRRVREGGMAERCFLPRLISRCILQFQISASVEQCTTLMNATMDLMAHEIELRYAPLRYITWLIPSLGFIGTVTGIGHALAYAGEPGRYQEPTLLTEVTGRLAVSFDGTLVALVMAAILMFWQNIVETREELALNASGQYCLDHLINRIYVDKAGRPA